MTAKITRSASCSFLAGRGFSSASFSMSAPAEANSTFLYEIGLGRLDDSDIKFLTRQNGPAACLDYCA